MLLLRGATQHFFPPFRQFRFQYMLLLRGATQCRVAQKHKRTSFNTCSSCEEQLRYEPFVISRHGFNTCSSCEEQLSTPLTTSSFCAVSIHAPLARSNFPQAHLAVTPLPFQYMLLLRGATLFRYSLRATGEFQYMLLLRGATQTYTSSTMMICRFNTCSSCEEQHHCLSKCLFPSRFNTCSSCEEQHVQRGIVQE